MNLFYITGTSRGLGYALANEILKSEDNMVIGIGRHSNIEHPNYKHKRLDLSDTVEVSKFRFGDHAKMDQVTLINNAGTLGQMKYIGSLKNKELVDSLHINLVSPSVLMNNFTQAYLLKEGVEKRILNISSGASVSPYDGWASYCTSKAGLNMIGEVLNKEIGIKGDSMFKVLNIAPGIIETNMQERIREANADDFSLVDKFKELKSENQLQTPEETAVNLLNKLDTYSGTETFIDLRS